MSASLVGSEMCIRDSPSPLSLAGPPRAAKPNPGTSAIRPASAAREEREDGPGHSRRQGLHKFS
eukprot:15001802-Alexandrium_andersonii.AAC.1